eukprot:5832841-Pleurochrysis_carterae.AAC.1
MAGVNGFLMCNPSCVQPLCRDFATDELCFGACLSKIPFKEVRNKACATSMRRPKGWCEAADSPKEGVPPIRYAQMVPTGGSVDMAWYGYAQRATQRARERCYSTV